MRLAYFAGAFGDDGSGDGSSGDGGSTMTDSNMDGSDNYVGTTSTLTDSNQGDGGYTLPPPPPPPSSDPFGIGQLQPATSTDFLGGGLSTPPPPPPSSSFSPSPVTTLPYNPGVSSPPLVQAPSGQSNPSLSTSSGGLFPGFLTGPGGFLTPANTMSPQSGMSTTTIALIVLGAAALAIALLKGRPA